MDFSDHGMAGNFFVVFLRENLVEKLPTEFGGIEEFSYYLTGANLEVSSDLWGKVCS